MSYLDVGSLSGVGAPTQMGSLSMINLASVPDLTPLRELRSIANMALIDCAGLEIVDLPWLTVIGGGLYIERSGLRDLDGLSALQSVSGDVVIRDNPSLSAEEIERFLAHVAVGGEVVVE